MRHNDAMTIAVRDSVEKQLGAIITTSAPNSNGVVTMVYVIGDYMYKAEFKVQKTHQYVTDVENPTGGFVPT